MSNAHYDEINRERPPVWLAALKVVPTTGQALVMPDGVYKYNLLPAGTLATLTVKLPAKPYHDQEVLITTSQEITLLTVTANSGQTFATSASTAQVPVSQLLPAGKCVRFTYDLANTRWYNAGTDTTGQFITSTVASGSAVALTTATSANVTSISLTAGDWDISGQIDYALIAATSTLFQSGISLTSATLPSQAGGSGLGTDPLAQIPLTTTLLSATYGQGVGPVRLSIAATTTVFLVANQTFSAGSSSAYGTIRARRII
jgi:hypothetical protein